MTAPRLRRALAFPLLLGLVWASDVGSAARPRAVTAAISGVVRDAASRAPIADALVELSSAGMSFRADVSARQFTDSRGRFVFPDLPPRHDYSITAAASGYFDGAFGARHPNEFARRTIVVADGQWLSTADIPLWPHGSMSGTVTDESGEPVAGVFVRAVAVVHAAGRERLAAGPLTTTDDRGRYRLATLPPGRYAVFVPSVQSAVPADATLEALAGSRRSGAPDAFVEVDDRTRLVVGQYPVPPAPDRGTLAYPPAFSGGGSPFDTPGFALGAGDDLDGIDVRLTPVPAVRVSGVVDGPPDARGHLVLRLVPDGLDGLGPGAEAAATLTTADGRFTFAHVPAGRYTIEAPVAVNQYLVGGLRLFYAPQIPRLPGQPGGGTTGGPIGPASGVGFADHRWQTGGYWARLPIAVGAADLSNVVVPLTPTMTMSGRFVVEQDPSKAAPARPPQYVQLESATGDPREGIARSVSPRQVAAGDFRIEGVLPGHYLLRAGEAPWMVKSVQVGGREYAGIPIDMTSGADLTGVAITFTNAAPSLGGMARRSDGTPAADATVIAFPFEPERWTDHGLQPARIRTALTTTTGSFRLPPLPAGAYYVIAVPSAGAEWHAPHFLQQAAPLATRVDLEWGRETTIALEIVNVR